MPKTRSNFVCQNCGRRTPKLMGRCPSCGEFNTMIEEVTEVVKASDRRAAVKMPPKSKPQRLTEISNEATPRLRVPIAEFNRVLGGGIVPGSITLIGGDPGVGKCVTADTRIIDPESGAYLPIECWSETLRPALSLNDSDQRLKPTSTLMFHAQGTRPVVQVTTELGRRLRCTAHHPVLTPQGWQAVEQLQVGDRIASPRTLPYFGNEALPEAHVKLIAYILSDSSAQSQISVTNMLPEVESDMHAIATAFGVRLKTYSNRQSKAYNYRFVQDHSVRGINRAHFADNLKVVQRELNISWAEWSRRADVSYGLLNNWRRGTTVPTEIDFDKLCRAVGVAPERLLGDERHHADMLTSIARFLESVGLRYLKAGNKFIPACIFTLPREQMAMFLKCLFSCDGSIYIHNTESGGISYATISRQLAEDVQHLLLRFGFVFKLCERTQRVNGQPYCFYELTLFGIKDAQRFIQTIGIFGREEAVQAITAMDTPEKPSTQRDTIPVTEDFWLRLRDVAGSNFAEISRQVGAKVKYRPLDRPLTRCLVQKIAAAYPDAYFEALANGDVYWDEITQILPDGEAPVYDITVAQNANFVANDLIVHNSTLITQVCNAIAAENTRVLYVSGEESAQQIKLRADRLGLAADELFLLTETNLGDIMEHVRQNDPTVLVIDSIQTVYSDESESSPGSVSQVRECGSRLQNLAKTTGVSVFLIGHVTKEGNIAGPRMLEHLVDTVLYLEGDPFQAYRLLRGVKNRFGATSEVGVFEMSGDGMIEVPNPSEAFLAERVANAAIA